MKTCSKCDLSYDDDKKFCRKCGNPLTSEYHIEPKEVAKKSVLEDRLKADPLNLELLHEYAQFLFNNLLFKETVTVSLKILALNEKDFAAQELVFKSYCKLKLYKDAYEIGEQLHAENPSDIFLLKELSNLAKDLGNTEKAILYYDKILKIKSTDYSALYNKALLLIEKNQLNEAIEIFKNIYQENAQNDRITTIYVGVDSALNGNFENAISLLNPNLIDESINKNDINNNRGFLYIGFSLSQIKKNILEVAKWISEIDLNVLNKNYQIHDEEVFAKTILYISEFVDSKEKIEYLESRYLNNKYFTKISSSVISEVWYNLGIKLSELKLYKDAQLALNKAIELNPSENKFKDAYAEINTKIKVASIKKKTIKYIGIGVIFIFIIACIAVIWSYLNFVDKNEFEIAKKQNTFESYQYYLNEHPKGKYIFEVKELWNKVRTADSLANVARNEKEIQEFDKSLNDNSINDNSINNNTNTQSPNATKKLNQDKNEAFYVINVAAVKTENDAMTKVNELKKNGYESDYLWIPDYTSLSGAKFYLVYIGPYSTQYDCEVAIEEYKKNHPKAYGLLVSQDNKRVQINGIGKVTVSQVSN